MIQGFLEKEKTTKRQKENTKKLISFIKLS